ncbi:MAG: PilZ domain-containing protein [Candidatus Scalindua sp.]
MQVEAKDSDRRVGERLDLTLQILLNDQDGKTVNISNTGVFFEVITDDIHAFSPGTEIPIQITADTTTPGLSKRKIKLSGNGIVIRNNIKNITSRGNQMCVAVEFNNKLNISDYLT